ncbi:uncharacterized protein LOC115359125 [Myripristis murdjan]|uniref:uncharacterized protein LOC115359125 n=1 Tax=Myripristis murdjan TaxID=586833 RepID=UPI001176217E|nr:uncharacterized protein LOC115359125 [Myripristis murdjan]
MEDHTYYIGLHRASKREASPSRRSQLVEAKRVRDQERQKTRVNIGAAFPRWRALRRDKRLNSDTEVACFLLDSYHSANPSQNTPQQSSRNSSATPRGRAFSLQPFAEGLLTGLGLQNGAGSSVHHAAAVQSFVNGTNQRKRDIGCQNIMRQDNWTMTDTDLENQKNKDQNGVDSRQCDPVQQSDASAREARECLSTSTGVDDGQYLLDLESPTQHVVDEECILQLFRSCLECNKQCTVRKRVRGLRLVVYQACYYCHCRCKWSSQPEGEDN